MTTDNPTADQGTEAYNQRVALLKARTKAYRWPKGKSGNPGGISRFYYEARRIAQKASPEMMAELVRLALEAEDERVRSVCVIAVLDRAGLKPIEAAEMLEQLKAEEKKPKYDPSQYTMDQLQRIDMAIKIIKGVQNEKAAEAEIIPPE